MIIPSVGDVLRIKKCLHGCNNLNDSMKVYEGATARVTSLHPLDRYDPKGTNFIVHLDIDEGLWFWYDFMFMDDPDGEFKC